MEKILQVDPGLMLWTIFNFLIFLGIILKFGTKPLVNGLRSREKSIQDAIEKAEQASKDAQEVLALSHEKIKSTQKEISEMLNQAKQQGDMLKTKAADEAEFVKKQKIDEAVKEINRSKEIAIKELRNEVAELVVIATEKILEEKLDKEKHYDLVKNYMKKLPQN